MITYAIAAAAFAAVTYVTLPKRVDLFFRIAYSLLVGTFWPLALLWLFGAMIIEILGP